MEKINRPQKKLRRRMLLKSQLSLPVRRQQREQKKDAKKTTSKDKKPAKGSKAAAKTPAKGAKATKSTAKDSKKSAS